MAAQRCGWCGTGNGPTLTNCTSCGSPLPPPSAPDPGPPPPPPPRALPGRYTRKQILGGFGVAWGVIFGGIGGMLAVIFTAVAFVFPPMLFGALFGGMFFLIGATVVSVSIYSGLGRIRPLRSGTAVVAEIVRVSNGADASSGTVAYTFAVGEQIYGGTLTTADPRLASAAPGHHLHVVYLPGDPTQNSVWPPALPADLL